MLDRVNHPARGRRGGLAGAPTTIARNDGTPMKGKGKQFVPHGKTVIMEFPGGGGYGPPEHRDPEALARDVALGYISPEEAETVYGMDASTIEEVLALAKRGNIF